MARTAISSNGSYIVATGGGDTVNGYIYVSENYGENWVKLKHLLSTDWRKVEMDLNNVTYLTDHGGKLYKLERGEDLTSELKRFWDFRKTPSQFSSSITDSMNGIVATLYNFTNNDTDYTGLTFDGSTNYIDLSLNSINVGGNYTQGNGFSFETYVMPSQVSENRTIMCLLENENSKLELTTGQNTTLSLTNSGTTQSVSSSNALSTTQYSHIVELYKIVQ